MHPVREFLGAREEKYFSILQADGRYFRVRKIRKNRIFKMHFYRFFALSCVGLSAKNPKNAKWPFFLAIFDPSDFTSEPRSNRKIMKKYLINDFNRQKLRLSDFWKDPFYPRISWDLGGQNEQKSYFCSFSVIFAVKAKWPKWPPLKAAPRFWAKSPQVAAQRSHPRILRSASEGGYFSDRW